jgi:hypothetical protein
LEVIPQMLRQHQAQVAARQYQAVLLPPTHPHPQDLYISSMRKMKFRIRKKLGITIYVRAHLDSREDFHRIENLKGNFIDACPIYM